jgi:predicted negative regulator of RcsB-dependent stress response
MKRNTIAVCTTAVLIFAVWFGWQRYAEAKKAKEREMRERIEGYERCVEPLNQNYPVGTNNTPEAEAANQRARKACRDFWFSGAK